MQHLQYFSMSRQIPATLIIVIFFNLALFVSAQTPPPTQTNLGYNDVLAPQFLVGAMAADKPVLRSAGILRLPLISI